MRALVIVALLAAPAAAFPQLAVRDGVSRCSMCHVDPAGGGLLTPYGRDASATLLSRGGSGGFLGLVDLPEWLLAGGDLRAAGLAYEDRKASDQMQLAAFPMQADLRAGVTAGGFTIAATGGLRGSTRLYSKSEASYFVSAEHYAMWEGSAVYVRAGRFFPVQGLRLPDHTLYIRRYTGTNLFEEPYALAIGHVDDDFELHATGFIHDPYLDVGRREAGGALHAALHGPLWEIAMSVRVGSGDDGLRAIAGPSARFGAGPIVFLAEADAIRDQVSGGSPVNQIAAFVGADTKVIDGLTVLAWGEEYQERLGFLGSAHHGVGLAINFYPRAHWELILDSRWERIGDHQLIGLEMLQVHYYL